MSGKLLLTILDSTDEGIFALKAIRDANHEISDFSFIFVNKRAVEILKSSQDNLVGQRLSAACPEISEQGLFDAYVHVAEHEEQMHTEFYADHEDTRKWFKVTATKFEDGVVATFSDITQEKIIEENNKKNRQLLEKILDGSSDAFVLLKPLRNRHQQIYDFEYVSLNSAAEQMLGKTQMEIIGNTVLHLFPATKEASMYDLYMKATEENEPFDIEFFYPHEGLNHWFRQRGSKLDGHILIITTDITARKKFEINLLEKQKFIESLVDSSPNLLYLFNPQTNQIIYINKKITEYLGYSPDQIQEKKENFILQLIHPEDKLSFLHHLQQLASAKDKEVVEHEYRLKHCQGHWLWFRSYDTIFSRDTAGKPISIVGNAENITAKKEAEDERQKLKALFDHSSDFVGIADPDGYAVYINQAGQKLVGLEDLEETKQVHVLDFFMPEEQDKVQNRIFPLLYEKERWSGEMYFRHFKTGQSIPVLWSVFIVKDNKNQPAGIACISQDLTERKEREHQLRMSEAKFRTLFEKSNDAILLLENNKFIDCNEAAVRLLKASSKEQILSTHPWDMSPEYQPDGELSYKEAEKIIETTFRKGWHRFEWVHRKLTGEDFWVEVLLTALTIDNQQVLHAVWRDISDRKEAEKQLLKLNNELEARVKKRTEELQVVQERFILSTMATEDAIWDWNIEEDRIIWNDNFYAMFGFSKEEVEENLQFWHQHLHPEDKEKVIRGINSAIQKGDNQWTDEYRFVNGENVYYILDRGYAVYNKEGKVYRMVGSMTNITERKLAEEKIREKNKTLALLYSIGKTVSAELELKKVVQAVTDIVTELSGAAFGAFFYNVIDDKGEHYTLYSLSGAPRDAFSSFPLPRNTRIFAPTFTGEDIVRSDDITKDPRYGHNYPYKGMPEGHLPVKSYLAVPVITRNGDVIGGIFLGHPEPDIFQKKTEDIVAAIAAQAAIAIDNSRLFEAIQKKNQELIAINNDLDNFVYTASHDLKAPITNIEGLLDILLKSLSAQSKKDQKVHSVIDMMRSSAQKLVQTVQDLADISKIQKNVNEETENIDIQKIIESIKINIQPLIEETDAQIILHIDECPFITFSKVNFNSLLYNLLSNAIKYHHPHRKPEVIISCTNYNNLILLQIKDNGLGIDSDKQDKIFQMFKRLHSHVEGTGVGLYLVKRIVENVGGKIEVESKPDKGTTFSIYLPDLSK